MPRRDTSPIREFTKPIFLDDLRPISLDTREAFSQRLLVARVRGDPCTEILHDTGHI